MCDTDTLRRKTSGAYHHGDLREALVATAFAEVDRLGSDAISITALARSLGVSPAAPYRHFADREELMAAVATRAFHRLTDLLHEAANGSGPGSRLSRLSHAYLRLATQHMALYRLMFGSRLIARAAIGSELQLAVDAAFREVLSALDSDADPNDLHSMGLKLWISLHGIVQLVDTGFLPLKVRRTQPEEFIDAVVADAERAIKGVA